MLQAIAGADGIDDRQLSGCPGLGNVPDYPAMAKQGIAGLRIGIVAESLDTPLTDKRYADMVVTAAHKFSELGASTVETVSLPGPPVCLSEYDGPRQWTPCAIHERLHG